MADQSLSAAPDKRSQVLPEIDRRWTDVSGGLVPRR